MADNEMIKELSDRHKFLEDERQQGWDPHYQEVTDYILPRRGFYINRGDQPNQGDKKHSKIIDATATRATRVLSAGMQGGLTSPARPWYRLSLDDKELVEFGAVKDWLFNVEKLMYAIFSKSNFYSAIHNVYVEEAGFGTSCMFEEEDPRFVVRFRVMTAGEYVLAEGPGGMVDTVGRHYYNTAIQMVKKFGEENVSDAVKKNAENQPDTWHQVVHMIQPREEYDPSKLDAKNMPYESIYFEHNNLEKALRESGYREFPCMCPRWDTSGSAIYGRSPGMDVLGDVKALQEYNKAMIKGVHKLVDPPVRMPAAQRRQKVRALPGGVTYYDGDAAAIGALYEVRFDVQSAMGLINDTRMQIREGLFNDLFLMLLERPNMTATEVAERHEEKLLMLGPVIERQFHELLDPVIDRTFDIMFRIGMIPPPPEEIQGMPLRIEYISLLAQAQKLVATQSMQAGLGFVGNLAAATNDVGVWDKIDLDQAIDEYAEAVGLPPKIIRPDDVVIQIRQRRAAELERQQRMQQEMATAETAKKLSETDTEGPNALTDLKRSLEGV